MSFIHDPGSDRMIVNWHDHERPDLRGTLHYRRLTQAESVLTEPSHRASVAHSSPSSTGPEPSSLHNSSVAPSQYELPAALNVGKEFAGREALFIPRAEHSGVMCPVYIAEVDEIRKELRLCLQKAGRKLMRFQGALKKRQQAARRMKIFEKYHITLC